MKNYLLPIINLVGLVVLYILFFALKPNAGGENKANYLACDSTQGALLPMAYINVDSLLEKYDFAKEEYEKLLQKQENSRLTFNQRTRKWEEDYMDFQRKIENNVYSTRERAEQENNRLMKQQQELQKLEARLTSELAADQQKVNMQLNDTINLVLGLYNAEKKYQIILSNTMKDNILLADDRYNITNEVIDLLNSRYTNK